MNIAEHKITFDTKMTLGDFLESIDKKGYGIKIVDKRDTDSITPILWDNK